MTLIWLVLGLAIADVDKPESTAALLVRVQTNPKDEQAHLELGKIYFLELGQVNPGLFYFAQGSDRTWRLLAQRDLAGPEGVEECVTLGDAWWDLAEKEKVVAQRHLRLRAVHWYMRVLGEVSGLRRGRLESRIRIMEGKSVKQ